jgi:hypothetical protein
MVKPTQDRQGEGASCALVWGQSKQTVRIFLTQLRENILPNNLKKYPYHGDHTQTLRAGGLPPLFSGVQRL